MAAVAAPALQFMLQKLDAMLTKEQQLLEGVDSGIKDIRDELESIKLFMQQENAKEDGDGMKPWVRQVRELAYDIEDVLEEFLLLGQPRGHGVISFLKKCGHYIRHLYTRHRIATAIEDIRKKIKNISLRNDMYSARYVDEDMRSDGASARLHNRHVAALFVEEAELVGIDKPREDLIHWLINGEQELNVISVVGMGGLGKTTLVRKVYDDERVKKGFNSHAWITVTQSFTTNKLLRSIIYQFYEEINETLQGRIDNMEGIQLVEILKSFLQDKSYVVVFDDVWNIHSWESLRYALPSNRCGSRILVTTRIGVVALSCQELPGHIYNLLALPQPKAWSLFCKKAFRSNRGRVCPPDFKDIAEYFVKECEGLPLAIVAIGGLLSKKQSLLEWQTMSNNLHTEWENNPKLEPVKRILSLSYNDLPQSMKSCFLYFSIFPKDRPVKRITLIRVWIAEGFIESGTGETMEAVAVQYLNDLIDRSMVQVAEYYDYGRVRSCQVHDFVHEIITLKSKKENFSTYLARKNTQIYGRTRRVAIHNSSEDVLQNISLTHLRAMFIFGAHSMSLASMRNLLHNVRLLRVLDLEGAPIDKFPVELGTLIHLRYLSLRNTKISKISKSLGKLKNLETLDLKGTSVIELPSEVIKLQKLRHILAYTHFTDRNPPFYYTTGVKVPQGIGGLRELQKLAYLEASEDSHILRELGNLAQLKRLGIVKLRSEDGVSLCASLQKMTNLHSFSVTSGMDEHLELQSLLSPPPRLQRLYLRGPLQKLPHWVSSLAYLVRLRLSWSRLKDDSVSALQDLPNLVELTMIHAFEGERLNCGKGGFQKLSILDLEQMENLNYVTVDGAMPNLRKMYMRGCVQLKMVPQGIGQLKNLKELHLVDMPEAFIQRLRGNGGEDYQSVRHIPIRRCYDSEK